MRSRRQLAFLNRKVREDSVKYLLIKHIGKGIGVAIPLVFTGILALFAYKSFQVANYNKLASDYSNIVDRLNQEQAKSDMLNRVISSYKSKRFMIHKEETKVLFSDVYFYFSGIGRNDYTIFKFKKPISYGTNLPVAPDTFAVDGQKYYFITERTFKAENFLADSAVIYWDSLKTGSSK